MLLRIRGILVSIVTVTLLAACGGGGGGGGGGNTSSTAFSPADLSGLVLWLKADALTGVSNNDPIATWPDSSGNGNDATQALASATPVYRANYLNGLPAVSFDGNDLLTTSNISLGAFTTFVIFNSNINGMPVSHGNAVSGNGHWIWASTGCTLDVRRGGVTSGRDLSPNWGSDDVIRGVTHVFDGTHAGNVMYVDGVLQTLVDCPGVGTNDPGTTPTSQTFGVGARSTATNLINGEIAEVIVYNRALSDSERQQVEQHLTDKYN